MGMQCCCKFLKIIVVVVNALITVIGILILVLGAIVLYGMSNNFAKDGDKDYFFMICVTIIAMGSLLMIVGLVGCCGAAYENQCLLGTFVCLMTMALALDIAAAVLLDNHKDNIKEENDKFVTTLFSDMAKNAKHIELYQLTLRCCGKTDFSDWTKARIEIPKSCCTDELGGCVKPGENPQQTPYSKGCLLVSQERIKMLLDNSPIILGVAGIFETLAIVTTLGLCCFIRKGGFY